MQSVISISVGLVLCLVGVLFMLPSQKVVERKALVKGSAQKVFKLLSSSRAYQEFNPYKDTDPALKIAHSGPEEGVGSAFAFEGKEGKGTQTIVALEKDKWVKVEIDLGPMGKPTTTFSLTPKGEQTEVTWTTTSRFGYNLVGRVAGLFLEGMLGKTYERGLKNLNTALKA